jgi:hypothetical protein
MILGDTVSKIMDYENGEMSDEETVAFFAELVRSGLAWQLQGSYGRTAANLIDRGYIDHEGNILKEVAE